MGRDSIRGVTGAWLTEAEKLKEGGVTPTGIAVVVLVAVAVLRAEVNLANTDTGPADVADVRTVEGGGIHGELDDVLGVPDVNGGVWTAGTGTCGMRAHRVASASNRMPGFGKGT
jgi:hypothetical protein